VMISMLLQAVRLSGKEAAMMHGAHLGPADLVAVLAAAFEDAVRFAGATRVLWDSWWDFERGAGRGFLGFAFFSLAPAIERSWPRSTSFERRNRQASWYSTMWAPSQIIAPLPTHQRVRWHTEPSYRFGPASRDRNPNSTNGRVGRTKGACNLEIS